MNGQVKFEFDLPATVKKRGKFYVAHCPLIDVTSQGDSKKEALDHLIEAIQLFIESCFDRGTLDEVLRACGFEFRAKGSKPKPRKLAAKAARTECVRVPLSLLIARRHAEARTH
jgi:predicted RNase H-like HicB family nuclease